MGFCGSFESRLGNQHQSASDKFCSRLANTDGRFSFERLDSHSRGMQDIE